MSLSLRPLLSELTSISLAVGSAENYYGQPSPTYNTRGSDSSHYPSAVPSISGMPQQPVLGATTFDERLDPNMGLGNEGNHSQTSLGDENDYSRKRVLRCVVAVELRRSALIVTLSPRRVANPGNE